TQDTVAQALATYMRTILSGDSLYDRADRIRRERKSTSLTAEHFRDALDDQTAQTFLDDDGKKRTRAELPALFARGHELFHGKARCATCHPGPLFTDHDYHNVGYPGDEGDPPMGKETGRAAHVPIGLKERRLIGAFRTPTLRNLARTDPYFHNGSVWT